MKYLKRFIDWFIKRSTLYNLALVEISDIELENEDLEQQLHRSSQARMAAEDRLSFIYDHVDKLQNKVIECDRSGSLMRFNQDTLDEPVQMVIHKDIKGPFARTTLCVTLCPEEIFWNLDRNAGEHMRSYLEKMLAGQITKIVMEAERANGMKAR